MPTVFAAGLCSVLSAGIAFAIANRIQTAPDGQVTGPFFQAAHKPAPGEPGVSTASFRQSSGALPAQNTIAQLKLQPEHRPGKPEPLTGGPSPSRETGIWPTSTYLAEVKPESEGASSDQADIDEKGMSVMMEFSGLVSAQENPALAANASEKMEYLRKAFHTEARTKLPLYQEMRDAILAQNDYEYHRHANTVNAIAVFNNGTSLCTKDELFELATLLQVVMDARTSLEQKEPIEKMQELLDAVQAKNGLPGIGAISLQNPLR